MLFITFATIIEHKITMKKLTCWLLLLLGVMILVGCNNDETYADQKDRERSIINKYIADSAVSVISEAQFAAQNYTTNIGKNEYVLIEATGVYLQIVREGVGGKIKDGESVTLLCRYTERNMRTDSLEASNLLIPSYAYMVDKLYIVNNSGTFTGSFMSNQSSFVDAHRLTSLAVPKAWLVPLAFINVARPAAVGDEVAKVRIIAPHDVGHMNAQTSVTPYLYDITYEGGR